MGCVQGLFQENTDSFIDVSSPHCVVSRGAVDYKNRMRKMTANTSQGKERRKEEKGRRV